MSRVGIVTAYIAVVLAFAGFVVFIAGIAIEFVNNRPDPFNPSTADGVLSPAVLMALGGLAIAALMFLAGCIVISGLLVRQSRRQGSGYGDAYRLIERFRFRDAIPLLERSIHEGKETSDVLMLLTSAYAYTGQLAKAQATADRAVRLYPNDPDSYVTLANGYRLQAAYDEAARALMQAAELAPEQPVFRAELGFTQHIAGDNAAAVEAFKQAATHAMPAMYGVRVYYHLAQAYQAAGDTDKAMRATAKMMSARDGLAAWKTGLKALEGTAYGQALRYEIAAIEQALADADAGNLG